MVYTYGIYSLQQLRECVLLENNLRNTRVDFVENIQKICLKSKLTEETCLKYKVQQFRSLVA